MDFISPSESDRFARLDPLLHVEGVPLRSSSSLEVLRPFSVQGLVQGSGTRHRSVDSCSVRGLADPLPSALAVSHDLDGLLCSKPSRDFPG